MLLKGAVSMSLLRSAGLSVLSLAISFIVTANAWGELKIGYIRPEYVFKQYEPYSDAMKELERFEKEEVADLEEMRNEFQKELDEAQKNAVLMSEELRQRKQEELEKRRQAIEQSWDDLYRQPDGTLYKKQEELLQPIITRINKVLMRLGKDEGYDYILDAEQGVLYANEEFDMSDYLLEELEKDISSQ